MPFDPIKDALKRKTPTFESINQPLYTFDPSKTGFNRYSQSPNYEHLGYSPFWNNEAKYADYQSGWEVFKNSMNQLWFIGKDAFANNFQQYGRDINFLSTGKFDDLYLDKNSEAIENRQREVRDKYAIYTPSENSDSWKKYVPFVAGSGAFYGNLVGQLGFTFGTIGATVVENALLAFMTGTSGNVARAGRTGSNVYKALYGLVKAVKGADSFTDSIKAARATDKLLDAGSVMFKKGLNAYQMYHTAASEAAFEATQGYVEQKERLVEDYIQKNGIAPKGPDLDKIENNARELGNQRFRDNVGILMFSNSIQFGNWIKPFKPSSNELISAERIASKIGQSTLKDGSKVLINKNALSMFQKEYWKQLGVAGIFKPITMNLTEGLEEASQNIIDLYTQDFYTSKYNGQSIEASDALSKAFNEQLTTIEGWDNFMSGFLTGGITNMVRKGAEFVNPSARKQKTKTNETINSVIGKVNAITPQDLFNNDKTNVQAQITHKQNIQEALDRGDVFMFNNLKEESFRDFVFSSLRAGKLDLRIEQLNDLKSLEGEAFNQMFGIDTPKKTAAQYVDALIEKALDIRTSYDELSSKYTNPFNPNRYNKDSLEYAKEAIKSMSFEHSKEKVLRFADIAKDSRRRLDTMYSELGASRGYAEDILNDVNRNQKIKDLSKGLSNVDGVTRRENESEIKRLEEFGQLRAELREVEAKDKNIDTIEEATKVYNKIQKLFNTHIEKSYKGREIPSIINEEHLRDIMALQDQERTFGHLHYYLQKAENFNLDSIKNEEVLTKKVEESKVVEKPTVQAQQPAAVPPTAPQPTQVAQPVQPNLPSGIEYNLKPGDRFSIDVGRNKVVIAILEVKPYKDSIIYVTKNEQSGAEQVVRPSDIAAWPGFTVIKEEPKEETKEEKEEQKDEILKLLEEKKEKIAPLEEQKAELEKELDNILATEQAEQEAIKVIEEDLEDDEKKALEEQSGLWGMNMAFTLMEGTKRFLKGVASVPHKILSAIKKFIKRIAIIFVIGSLAVGTIGAVYMKTNNISTRDVEAFANRFLVKQGIIESDDAVLETKVRVIDARRDSVRLEDSAYRTKHTFFEKIQSVKQGSYNLWSYRNRYFANDGFEYIAGVSNKNFRQNTDVAYDSVQGVAHFLLLHSDVAYGADVTNMTTDDQLKALSAEKAPGRRDTDYVAIIERLGDGRVRLTYELWATLKNKELKPNQSTPISLRQTTVDDLDFNKRAEAPGFKKHIAAVYQKSTNSGFNSLVYKNKNSYGTFSGGSVVLLFVDKKGNTIVHEFTGSVDGLQAEISTIKKEFGIEDKDITLGVNDAGSYTGKPEAINNRLSPNQWKSYNPTDQGGATLMIPVKQTKKAELPYGLVALLALLKRKRENNEKITTEEIEEVKRRISELQGEIDQISNEYNQILAQSDITQPIELSLEKVELSESQKKLFIKRLLSALNEGSMTEQRAITMMENAGIDGKAVMEDYKSLQTSEDVQKYEQLTTGLKKVTSVEELDEFIKHLPQRFIERNIGWLKAIRRRFRQFDKIKNRKPRKSRLDAVSNVYDEVKEQVLSQDTFRDAVHVLRTAQIPFEQKVEIFSELRDKAMILEPQEVTTFLLNSQEFGYGSVSEGVVQIYGDGTRDFKIMSETNSTYVIQNVDDASDVREVAKEEVYNMSKKGYQGKPYFSDISDLDSLSEMVSFTLKGTGEDKWRKNVSLNPNLKPLVLKVSRNFSKGNQERLNRIGTSRMETFPSEKQKTERLVQGRPIITISRIYDVDITIHEQTPTGLSKGFFDFIGITNWVIADVSGVYSLFEQSTQQRFGDSFWDIVADQLLIHGKPATKEDFVRLQQIYFKQKAFREKLSRALGDQDFIVINPSEVGVTFRPGSGVLDFQDDSDQFSPYEAVNQFNNKDGKVNGHLLIYNGNAFLNDGTLVDGKRSFRRFIKEEFGTDLTDITSEIDYIKKATNLDKYVVYFYGPGHRNQGYHIVAIKNKLFVENLVKDLLEQAKVAAQSEDAIDEFNKDNDVNNKKRKVYIRSHSHRNINLRPQLFKNLDGSVFLAIVIKNEATGDTNYLRFNVNTLPDSLLAPAIYYEQFKNNVKEALKASGLPMSYMIVGKGGREVLQFSANDIRPEVTDFNNIEFYKEYLSAFYPVVSRDIVSSGNFYMSIGQEIKAPAEKPAVKPVKPDIKTPSSEEKKPEEPKQPGDAIERARQRRKKGRDGDRPKFWLGDGQVNEKIQWEKEIQWIMQNLPDNIKVKDLEDIILNLEIKGIPFGVFKKNVIYLSKNLSKKGSGYHEAFHVVFTGLLTDAERKEWIDRMAKKYKGVDPVVLRKFAASRDYGDLPKYKLLELYYEEQLAEQFRDWKVYSDTKTRKGVFAPLFRLLDKLVDFFRGVFNKTELLFQRIDSGYFKSRQYVTSDLTHKFELLPVEFEDNEPVKYLPQNIGKNIINVITGRVLADDSSDELSIKIGRAIANYAADYTDSAINARFSIVPEDRKDAYEANVLSVEVDVQDALGQRKTIELIREQVTGNINKVVQLLEDDFDPEESVEDFDVAAYEKSPLESINRELRKLMSYQVVDYVDKFGVNRQKTLDGEKIFNSLLNLLADTEEHQIVDKVENYSLYDEEMGYFFSKMKEWFGLVINNQQWEVTKNKTLWVKFVTSMNNTLLNHLVVRVNTSKTEDFGFSELQIINASTTASRTQKIDSWALAYREVISDKGHKYVASILGQIRAIYTNQEPLTRDELNDRASKARRLLKMIGFDVTKLYIDLSLISEAAGNVTPDLSKELALYSDKIDYLMSSKDITEILNTVVRNEDPFQYSFQGGAGIEIRTGNRTRLNKIAEGDTILDSGTPIIPFKNAEDKTVWPIVRNTSVTLALRKMKTDRRAFAQEEFNYDTEGDNFLSSNPFMHSSYDEYFNKLKVELSSGVRQDIKGAKTESREGQTFKNIDPRSYIINDIALYNNQNSSRVPGMLMSKSILMQLEATSTAYVVDMPIEEYYNDRGFTTNAMDKLLLSIKQEYDRISSEWAAFDKENPGRIKGYNNSPKGRAFKFFVVNEYFKNNDLGTRLIEAAKQGVAFGDTGLVNELKDIIANYHKNEVKELVNVMLRYGVLNRSREGKMVSSLIPSSIMKNFGTWIYNYHLNRHIQTHFFNQFFRGDAAKSYKSIVDIVKRQKQFAGFKKHLGSGTHKVKVISDGIHYVNKQNPIDVLTDVEYDRLEDSEKAKYSGKESTDGQSINTIYHRMLIESKTGRLNDATRTIYRDIIKGKELSSEQQARLESEDVTLRSLKTLTTGGVKNIYIKKSEHTLSRYAYSVLKNPSKRAELDLLYDQLLEMIDIPDTFSTEKWQNIVSEIQSYWEAMPGFEYWHNMLNEMEIDLVDEYAYASASKGFTVMDEVLTLKNSYKGIQTETPSGKRTVVEPTQLIELIQSEQDDSLKVEVAGKTMTLAEVKQEYRTEMAKIRRASSKIAMIGFDKDENGKYQFLKRASEMLEAQGANETMIKLFSGEFNVNLPNTRVDAERLFMSYFSKLVFKQKVPGFQMYLVTDYGHYVIEDEHGRVVTKDEIRRNPSKYRGYKQRALQAKRDNQGRLYFEVIIPHQFKFKGVKPGSYLNVKEIEEIYSMLGVRIPTGNKNYAQYLKVVDFLPAEYGSVIIVPTSIHVLSGSDLDIDKMYIQRKEFYYDAEGALKIFDDENDYEQYLAYIKTNPLVRNEINIYKNSPLEEEELMLLLTKGEDYVLDRALATLGYPVTQEMFEKWYPNNIGYNTIVSSNKSLDYKVALLTNSAIEKYSLQKETVEAYDNYIIKTRNLNSLEEAYALETGGHLVDSMLSRFKFNQLAAQGKGDIGIYAVANKIYALLSTMGHTTIPIWKVRIGDKVHIFDSYKESERDKLFGRRALALAGSLSLSVDNPKEPKLAILGLNEVVAGPHGEMLSLGMGVDLTLTIIGSKSVQDFAQYMNQIGYAIQNPGEETALSMEQRYNSYLSDLYPHIFDEYGEVKNPAFNKSLTEALVFNPESLSLEDDGFLQPKLLYLFIKQLKATNDEFRKFNDVISLTKQLPSSVEEIFSKLARIKSLGVFDPESNVYKNIISKDPLIRQNVDNLFSLYEIAQDVFITEVSSFKQITESLLKTLRTKEDYKDHIKRELLGFLLVKAYKRYLGTMSSLSLDSDYVNNVLKTFSVFSYLQNESDLIENFRRMKEKYPENALLKFLRVETDKGLEVINTSFRGSMPTEKENELIDSWRELMSSEDQDANIFAQQLYLASLVRDNLYFMGKSYIKFAPAEMFEKVSELIDEIKDTFSSGMVNEYIESEDFITEFFSLYGRNVRNLEKLRAFRSSAMIEDESVVFDIKNKDFVKGAGMRVSSSPDGEKVIFPLVMKNHLDEIYLLTSVDGVKPQIVESDTFRDYTITGSTGMYSKVTPIGHTGISSYSFSEQNNSFLYTLLKSFDFQFNADIIMVKNSLVSSINNGDFSKKLAAKMLSKEEAVAMASSYGSSFQIKRFVSKLNMDDNQYLAERASRKLYRVSKEEVIQALKEYKDHIEAVKKPSDKFDALVAAIHDIRCR
jgi:hypothetical protein